MQEKFELEMKGEGILYALAWEPNSGERLAAASSTGAIYLWDTVTGMTLETAGISVGKSDRGLLEVVDLL